MRLPAEFVPAVDGIGVVRREEGLRLLSLRRREIRIRVALVERWKYFHAPVENFSQMLGAVPSPRRVVYALVGFVRQTLSLRCDRYRRCRSSRRGAQYRSSS